MTLNALTTRTVTQSATKVMSDLFTPCCQITISCHGKVAPLHLLLTDWLQCIHLLKMCIFSNNQFHNVCILTGRRARAWVPHLIHSVSAGGSVQWLRFGWFWGPKRSKVTTALVLFSDVHPPFTKGGWLNIALAKIFDSIDGSVFKRRILGANSISWYAEDLQA